MFMNDGRPVLPSFTMLPTLSIHLPLKSGKHVIKLEIKLQIIEFIGKDRNEVGDEVGIIR